MIYRPAKASDFAHLETFVWQAVFPAFDLEELTDEQRAENDALVSGARPQVQKSLDAPDDAVFVAVDSKLRRLAGYVVLAVNSAEQAELVFIVARKAYWGKGVAGKLLELALAHAGDRRMISAGVRYFNDRAKAFLAKYGFTDTGEAAGEGYAIPRTLLVREAIAAPAAEEEIQETETRNPKPDPHSDFPTEADEPYFEELPDYSLTTEEAPLFDLGDNALSSFTEEEDLPGEPVGNNALSQAEDDAPLFSESTLEEGMLDELAAFIARAKAKKAGQADPAPLPSQPSVSKSAPKPPQPATPPAAFEFDFADVESSSEDTTASTLKIDDQEEPTEIQASPPPVVEAAQPEQELQASATTKSCPTCGTELPEAAKFCYNCGAPQFTASTIVQTEVELEPEVSEVVEDDDVLALPELEESNEDIYTDPLAPQETKDPVLPSPAPAASPRYTLSGLKQDFRELLTARVTAYFGSKSVEQYLAHLQGDERFQQVRDSGLNSLLSWLQANPNSTAAPARISGVQADLVEFFLVESAAELHGRAFPQRALRYQSATPETVDIFRLVMDYLNFTEEADTVYTDFVTMPPRALRNATNAFLKAGRDERILFICDQSLISQAKNGFAMTDTGVYWKNIFQPAGLAVYRTMAAPKIEGGHLVLDGQFFDAGSRLNLKLALLLDKLRRL